MSPLSLAGLPFEDSVKCLSVWWCSNFASRKSERICKAHGAFFTHRELSAFYGQLHPLSSRSLVETPFLMYGSESWCLNASLLSKLESFQAEVGKESYDYQDLLQTVFPSWPYNGHHEMPLPVCQAIFLAQNLLKWVRQSELRSVQNPDLPMQM